MTDGILSSLKKRNMNDWASSVVVILMGTAFALYLKKLLHENRRDAQRRLSPQPSPATPTPAMMEGGAQGGEKTPEDHGMADKEKECVEGTQQENAEERTAMTACLEFLHEYNCDVNFSQTDDTMCLVRFQGGTFYINVWNDHVAEVTFPNFHSVPLDDYDEISRVRKAINRVNAHDFFTLFYYIDEEQKQLSVYAKRACFLPSDMKHTSQYLFSVLSGCFEVARRFEDTLEAIKQEELEGK